MKPSEKMPESTFRRRMQKLALAFHRVLKTIREADGAVEELLDLLEDPRYAATYNEYQFRCWNCLREDRADGESPVYQEECYNDLPHIINDAKGVIWSLGVHHGHFSCVNPGGWLPKGMHEADEPEPASEQVACG